MSTYNPEVNRAKGGGEFAKASAMLVSYQGMVETVQWVAGLAGVEMPSLVANFLCVVAVASVAMAVRRIRNWRKHRGAR